MIDGIGFAVIFLSVFWVGCAIINLIDTDEEVK